MKIILNPNCSEGTMRIKLSNLTETEQKQLIQLIDTIYNLANGTENDSDISIDMIKTKFGLDEDTASEHWWDTSYYVDSVFGVECITIKGEAPHNESEWIHEMLEKLPFYKKLKIEEESG